MYMKSDMVPGTSIDVLLTWILRVILLQFLNQFNREVERVHVYKSRWIGELLHNDACRVSSNEINSVSHQLQHGQENTTYKGRD